MMIRLERYSYAPECTQGRMLINGEYFHTIERPWRNNAPSISCIPEGVYLCTPFVRPSGAEVYALINPTMDVYLNKEDIPEGMKGRYLILLHSANIVEEVEGCCAPGLAHGWMKGQAAVLSSRAAMARISDLLGSADHEMEITQVSGAI